MGWYPLRERGGAFIERPIAIPVGQQCWIRNRGGDLARSLDRGRSVRNWKNPVRRLSLGRETFTVHAERRATDGGCAGRSGHCASLARRIQFRPRRIERLRAEG